MIQKKKKKNLKKKRKKKKKIVRLKLYNSSLGPNVRNAPTALFAKKRLRGKKFVIVIITS
jgi:hypothetical protein